MPDRATMSLTLLAALLALLALPARAQSAEDGVIAQLRAQGYDGFEVSRTLLGRVRIVAVDEGRTREIVFNPATGEILRDYVDDDDDDDDDRVPRIVGGDDRGSDGGGGDQDSGGNDDDDDDDDDDNSGRGGDDDDD